VFISALLLVRKAWNLPSRLALGEGLNKLVMSLPQTPHVVVTETRQIHL
jgi:hypothetical protein